MLLDLTRSPIVVLSHECPRHIVVRTLQRPDVAANVVMRYTTSAKTYTKALEPGAMLRRGSQTLMETRLIPQWPLAPYNGEGEPTELRILADPYEVPSAYTDLLTHKTGSWRIQVQMQPRKNGAWLVHVNRVGEPVRVALEVRDLLIGRDRLSDCEFPLLRHTQKIAQGGLEPRDTAWDRLTLNDENPDQIP